MHNMAWALSEDAWTDVIREIVHVTRSGGYIELVELKRRGEATEKWNNKRMSFFFFFFFHVSLPLSFWLLILTPCSQTVMDTMWARNLVPRVCLNLQEMLHEALIQNADTADVSNSKKFFSVPYGE